MQSPWVFFTSALPNHHHHHHHPHAGTKPVTQGLIPINCPPAGAAPLLSTPVPALGAFTAAAAAAAHHPSQILLAAAAAAYGQQCAAASLLHQQQIPNGNYHMKVDESAIVGPPTKRKSAPEETDNVISREIKRAKLETKALKAKRPGFTDERYNETSYYVENGLRKVYPYYFTFTTFTKGRWVGEKILDVFAREFRAHPVEEYERCIKSGTLTVNYTKVDTDYRLKHNDLLANIVHRHEVPVTSDPIEVVHMDDDLVVVNKPASIPVHPCGRYRHNTVVFILAKEHQLKNLRTIHRLDRLTSGLLLFGRSPKKAREMEQHIRNRQVSKEYVCRVEGEFPEDVVECCEPIEVVSYKIGVCKVSKDGKDCRTTFRKLSYNGKSSVVIAKPHTGRMHQIRVHLQYLGYPIVNDPLYNHVVFGPEKGKGGLIGKSDEQLIADLISIHNAENWLGIEGEESGGPSGDIFGPPRPTPDSCSSCGQSSLAGGNIKKEIIPEAVDQANNSTLSPPPPHSSSTSTSSPSSATSSTGNAIPIPTSIPAPSLSPSSTTSTSAEPGNNNSSSHSPTFVTTTTQTTKLGQNVTPSINGKVTVGTQTCEEESSALAVANTLTASTSTSPTNSSSTQNSTMNHSAGTPTAVAASMSPSATSASTTSNSGTSAVTSVASNDSLGFRSDQMTYDPHCYECKVRYRDPKPKDLVMYLHAFTYKGPEWCFQTKLPDWAGPDWIESDDY